MPSCTNIAVSTSSVPALCVCTGTWCCRKQNQSNRAQKTPQSRLAGEGEIRMCKLKGPFLGGSLWSNKMSDGSNNLLHLSTHGSYRLPKKTINTQGSPHSHKNQLSSLRNFISSRRQQLSAHLTEPPEEEVAPADHHVGNGSSSTHSTDCAHH